MHNNYEKDWEYLRLSSDDPEYSRVDIRIDPEDYAILSKYEWYTVIDPAIKLFVIKRKRFAKSRVPDTLLTTTLMTPPSGSVVEHINEDTFDCRKVNLRITTRYQQQKRREEAAEAAAAEKAEIEAHDLEARAIIDEMRRRKGF